MTKKIDRDIEIRKFLQNKSDIDSQLKKLNSYSHEGGFPLYEDRHDEERKVQLIPDLKVERGKFIPVPLARHLTYRAHPVTISAVKKDLFFADDSFLDLSSPILCESCKREIDRQFWNFCPFCEASFPKG